MYLPASKRSAVVSPHAGASPESPEVDDHHCSAVGREAKLLAVLIGRLEVRRRLADLEMLPFEQEALDLPGLRQVGVVSLDSLKQTEPFRALLRRAFLVQKQNVAEIVEGDAPERTCFLLRCQPTAASAIESRHRSHDPS